MLTSPRDGIVGLVDDLLAACRKYELQLDWRPSEWRVRSFGGNWESLGEPPIRTAVFRAMLARIAVLCNQRKPSSVSPYGGEGVLVPPHDGGRGVITVCFTNTPSNQQLELCVSDVTLPRAHDRPDTAPGGRRKTCPKCGGTGKTSYSTTNPSCSDNPGTHDHDCGTCGGSGYLE